MEYHWPDWNKPCPDLIENYIFAYGIPKIGKTTFFSKFPDALFFLTEEGAKHVTIRGISIKNWTDFLVQLDNIENAVKNNSFPFKTVVIDTIDELTIMCDEFICTKLGIAILGDSEYGKAYSRYTKEFRKHIRRLTKLPIGIVFISHAAEKEVTIESVSNPYAPMVGDLQTGKVKMIIPTVAVRAYEFLSAMADMILYAELDNKNNRVLRTKPSKHFEAGDRSGRLPETLPLDYDAFVRAYYSTNGDDAANQEIINRINIAEQYLAEHHVDGFEVGKRAINSRKTHLKTDNIENATSSDLEAYLQHLRIKAKTKKEN